MSVRNQLIFLISVKSGLIAKEISGVRWNMVVDSSGDIGNSIHLTNKVSKGESSLIIPLNKDVKVLLLELFDIEKQRYDFDH